MTHAEKNRRIIELEPFNRLQEFSLLLLKMLIFSILNMFCYSVIKLNGQILSCTLLV